MGKQAPEKQNGTWRPFLTLLKATRLPWLMIGIVLVINLAYSKLQLISPQVTQRIMSGDVSSETIMQLVLVLLALAVVISLRQFSQAISVSQTTLAFRKTVLKKVMHLPVPYYDKNMATHLISRTTDDTTKLSDFFGAGVPFIPAAAYQMIGTLVILFGYNWRLVALEALIIPVVLLITLLQGRVQFKWNRRIQTRVAGLTGYLAESLTNIPLIKVFVKEQKEIEKGRQTINELYSTKKRFVFVSGLMQFLVSAESIAQTLIAVVGGVFLINGGHITLDIWIAFYLYSGNLVGGFTQLLDYWQRIKAAQGAASRISEIVSESDEERGGSLEMPKTAGELSLRGVTFRYEQDTILNNVSLTIPAGKVTVLLGRSGAGKSTVFGLLERFYLPESGSVLLEGRDAQEYDLSSWRRSIGYVPQNGILFSGTIRSNLVYGLGREVSEEELIRAAKNACIYDFIAASEHGFDTEVGEGGCKLAGGQRQRIAIARALLKDPAILLLDEATSNLDAESKAEVDEALARLKHGRTTVIVTHDLNGVETADQIIVLEGGSVSGCGTHEALLQSCEAYRRLKNAHCGAAATAQ